MGIMEPPGFSDRTLSRAAEILDAFAPGEHVLPELLREFFPRSSFGFIPSQAMGAMGIAADTRFRGVPMDLPAREFLEALGDCPESRHHLAALLAVLLRGELTCDFLERPDDGQDPIEHTLDLDLRRGRLQAALRGDGYVFDPERGALVFTGSEDLPARNPSDVRSSPTPPPPAPSPAPAAGGNRMRLEGAYWHIEFRGQALPPVKDSKGMRCIAVLLGRPQRQVGVLELNDVAEGRARPERSPGSHGAAGGTRQKLLDREARRDLAHRLRALAQEREEIRETGEDHRAAEIDEECGKIEKQIRSATGLGGQDRGFAQERARARSNLTQLIKRGVKAIGHASAELGRFLATTLHTGEVCAYYPDPSDSVVWTIDLPRVQG
ncbi:MAG: hypothetical protein HY608_01700 [Planctomycetes bacterium]|nr:hypothetical protein [Planctomycetota bacterium]